MQIKSKSLQSAVSRVFMLFFVLTSAVYSQSHPRVLVNASDKATLVNRILNTPANVTLNDLYDEMNSHMSSYKNHTIAGTSNNSRKSYGAYANAAFYAWLEDDTTVKNKLISVALSMENASIRDFNLYTNWYGQYIFYAAPYTIANAMIYDFCYDEMSNAERQIVVDNIYHGMMSMEDDFKDGPNRAHYKYNNWQPLYHGAYILGALAIAGDPYSSYTAAMLDADLLRTEEAMFHPTYGYMRYMFGDEGPYLEGHGYMIINCAKLFLLLPALSNHHNTDYYQRPVVADALGKWSKWLTAIMFPKRSHSSVFNSLTHTGSNNPGSGLANLLAISQKYSDGLARWLFDESFYQTNGNLNIQSKSHGALGDIYLPSLIDYINEQPVAPQQSDAGTFLDYKRGLLSWRTGWNDDDMMFTIESSPIYHHGEIPIRHTRPDQGSITLTAYGSKFIYDPGPNDDANANYPAGANNTIEVDIGHPVRPDILGGSHYIGEDRFMKHGEITDYADEGFFEYVNTYNADAYNEMTFRGSTDPIVVVDPANPPASPLPANTDNYWFNPVEQAERSVVYLKEEASVAPYYFWIIDEFEKDLTTSYDYYFQLFTDNANTVDISTPYANMAQVKAPGGYPRMDVYSIVPGNVTHSVSSGPTQSVAGQTTRLSLKKSNSVSGHFNTLLIPYEDEQPGSLYPTAYSQLGLNKGAGSTVTWPGNFTDYCLYTTTSQLLSPDIASDADQVFLRRNNSQSTWTRYFSYGGSFLSLYTQPIFDLRNSAGGAADADIVYSGDTLSITGTSVATGSAYAPDAIAVELNGNPAAFYRIGDYVYIGPVADGSVWSNNVYIHGNVLLPHSKSLTILPDTELLFAENSSLQIAGMLNASGTVSDSIFMRSDNGATGYGLKIMPVSESNPLPQATLEYLSASGLTVGLESNLATTTISDSRIADVSTGIRLINSDADIESNQIIRAGIGLDIDGSNPQVEDNEIINCNLGISLISATGTYTGNHIENRQSGEGAFYGGFSASGGSVAILQGGDEGGLNTIINNAGFGLRATLNSTIQAGDEEEGGNNRIFSNGGYEAEALTYSTISAINNFWGSGEPSENDFYDDATSSISYEPFLEEDPISKTAIIGIQPKPDDTGRPEAGAATSLRQVLQAQQWTRYRVNRAIMQIYSIPLNSLTTHTAGEDSWPADAVEELPLSEATAPLIAALLELSIRSGNQLAAEHLAKQLDSVPITPAWRAYTLLKRFNKALLMQHDLQLAARLYSQIRSLDVQGSISAIARNRLLDAGVAVTEQAGESPLSTAAEKTLPQRFVLEQNYPNPFNPETHIRFRLPETGHVTLEVFDLTGRRVSTLTKRVLSAGVHSFKWNGKDDRQQSLSTGIYLYRLSTASGINMTRKMILIK